MSYIVEQAQRNVHIIRMKPDTTKWEQWFLMTADRHLDHPKSNRKLQIKHLEEAKARGAGVVDVGDLACAMQGRRDPRSNKSALMPENAENDYLDKVVNNAVKFLAPYSKQFVLMGPGNHETGVLKHYETDLTQRIIDLLNTQTKSKIFRTGYTGWIRFHFTCYGTRRQSIVLWFTHGYGGDAPVTKGVIQTNRQAVYTPDAHIVMSGHTHNNWMFPIDRQRLTDGNQLVRDRQLHIKIPSYKDEYDDGWGGWEVERGAPPKGQGAWWLRFFIADGDVQVEAREAR